MVTLTHTTILGNVPTCDLPVCRIGTCGDCNTPGAVHAVSYWLGGHGHAMLLRCCDDAACEARMSRRTCENCGALVQMQAVTFRPQPTGTVTGIDRCPLCGCWDVC